MVCGSAEFRLRSRRRQRSCRTLQRAIPTHSVQNGKMRSPAEQRQNTRILVTAPVIYSRNYAPIQSKTRVFVDSFGTGLMHSFIRLGLRTLKITALSPLCDSVIATLDHSSGRDAFRVRRFDKLSTPLGELVDYLLANGLLWTRSPIVSVNDEFRSE
jgi:hypothetical protein